MIRRYIALCVSAVAVAVGGLGLSAQAADNPGLTPYTRVCGQCHGPDGKGDRGPPLVPMEREVSEILEIAREGRGMMPPLSEKTISDAEIKQVVEYLRTIKN